MSGIRTAIVKVIMQQYGQLRLSRRGLAALLASAGIGVAGCEADRSAGSAPTAPPATGEPVKPAQPGIPDGALGANFNGATNTVTFPGLEAMNSSWLRGFVTMHRTDQDDLAQQPELRLLLEASRRGYGTSVSLKFQNSDRPLPRPGSAAMNADLGRLDKVLSSVMDRVELLCIGNEPFLETRRSDRTERLNEYYETLTRHVIDYRRRNFPDGCRTHLFLGALNHLDRPSGRTRATARWLDYARRTPEIEGVDIHPHVDDPKGTDAYLDYVLPKLRGDQRILVTEFSLVLFWKKQLRKPVPARYAQRYGLPTGTPVWKAVRAAIYDPVPQQQWNDLCSMSPWYEQNKDFLSDQVHKFRETGKVAFASYGIGQDDPMVRDFNTDTPPWLFNSVFATKTVQPAPDGLPGRGYAWIDQFRALQRPHDDRPTR